jgi:hypothetical protein
MLRQHEYKQIYEAFSIDQIIEIKQRERLFADEYEAKIVALPEEEFGENSSWFDNWTGDIEWLYREYHLATVKEEKRQEKYNNLLSSVAKLDWVEQMRAQPALEEAERDLAWQERYRRELPSYSGSFYGRLNEWDRKFLERPNLPIMTLDDIPQSVEHLSMVFWPDELPPFRKAVVSMIDELLD